MAKGKNYVCLKTIDKILYYLRIIIGNKAFSFIIRHFLKWFFTLMIDVSKI